MYLNGWCGIMPARVDVSPSALLLVCLNARASVMAPKTRVGVGKESKWWQGPKEGEQEGLPPS